MMRFFRDPVRIMRHLHARYGAVAAVSAGDPSLICAFGAEINRQVLSQPDRFHNAAELPIRSPPGSALQRLTTMLVGMNGDQHRKLRRAMTPLFQKSRREDQRDKIVAAAEVALSAWRTGETIDLSAATAQLALCVAFRCLFDLDVTSEARSLADMALGFMNGVTSLKLILAPVPLPGLPYWRFLKQCERLEECLLELIAERRSSAAARHDALSVLMSVEHEGERLDDSLLIGLANELFIAGHDTVARTLAWTLFLLERHPAVLANLLDELTPVLGGGAPTVDQLDRLPYLDAVVKESMRVLPATPFLFFRRNQAEVHVGGYEVPRGASLVVSPLITHHLPELYPAPNRFDPDRWSTANPGPYEYLPFGAGARMCLGSTLANVSVRVIVALIVQRYRLGLVQGAAVSYQARGIILGTKNPLQMHVRRQDRAKARPEPIRGNIHDLVDLRAM